MNDIELYLSKNFSKFKGGTLCIFGDWFGRPHDNFHQPQNFSVSDDLLTVTFDQNETLMVWNPKDIKIDENTFVVNKADHVRWEWFFYGRPPLDENKYFMDYVCTANGIQGNSDVDWYSHTFTTSESKPAVKIE